MTDDEVRWTPTQKREASYQMHNLYSNVKVGGTECPTCGGVQGQRPKYSAEDIAAMYECSVDEACAMIEWAERNPPMAPMANKKEPRKYRVKHYGL